MTPFYIQSQADGLDYFHYSDMRQNYTIRYLMRSYEIIKIDNCQG
jgi:hypothetical protein